MSEAIFYLFAGDRYYPAGGARDFIGHDFDLAELRGRALGLPEERPDDECDWYWWQIADSNMLIVEEGEYPQKPLDMGMFGAPTHASLTMPARPTPPWVSQFNPGCVPAAYRDIVGDGFHPSGPPPGMYSREGHYLGPQR